MIHWWTADNVAMQCNISRDNQDKFVLSSQQKAQAAIDSGKFSDEIISVLIPQRKVDPKTFDIDKYPCFNATIEGLENLRTAFQKDGTVTAGNASGLNNSTAMVIVCAKDKAVELKLPILGSRATPRMALTHPSWDWVSFRPLGLRWRKRESPSPFSTLLRPTKPLRRSSVGSPH